MNDKQRENLRELIERFGEGDSVRDMLGDIEQGEGFLRGYPAPEPSAEVLAVIKRRMVVRALHRRRFSQRMSFRAAAVAAAVIVVAMVWNSRQGGDGGGPTVVFAGIPTAIWESDNIAADDLRLASFVAEIERLENEVKALLSGESSSDELTLDEVEMELLEIEGDFWKG